MNETAQFIQGTYSFRGAGIAQQVALSPPIRYRVPSDKRTQLIYFRAGNSSAELVSLCLNKAGRTLRLFPLGAKSAIHVQLAIVEDIDSESELDLTLAAPEGVEGVVVIDIGLLEI